MRKTLYAFILISFLAGFAETQTPQYYNYENVGPSSNFFPFAQSNGKAVNWLFLPGDLNMPSPCPPGRQITKVYFLCCSRGFLGIFKSVYFDGSEPYYMFD